MRTRSLLAIVDAGPAGLAQVDLAADVARRASASLVLLLSSSQPGFWEHLVLIRAPGVALHPETMRERGEAVVMERAPADVRVDVVHVGIDGIAMAVERAIQMFNCDALVAPAGRGLARLQSRWLASRFGLALVFAPAEKAGPGAQ